MLNMVSRHEIGMLVRKDHKRQAVWLAKIPKEAGSLVGQCKQPGIVRGSLNRIVAQSLLAQFWAPPELTNTAFGHPPSY